MSCLGRPGETAPSGFESVQRNSSGHCFGGPVVLDRKSSPRAGLQHCSQSHSSILVDAAGLADRRAKAPAPKSLSGAQSQSARAEGRGRGRRPFDRRPWAGTAAASARGQPRPDGTLALHFELSALLPTHRRGAASGLTCSMARKGVVLCASRRSRTALYRYPGFRNSSRGALARGAPAASAQHSHQVPRRYAS